MALVRTGQEQLPMADGGYCHGRRPGPPARTVAQGMASFTVHSLILRHGLASVPPPRLIAAASSDGKPVSTVGWITECFRLGPGTFRSDHYSHSVAARGKGAREFAAEHLCREGLDSPWDREPWGKTYGLHSPMVRAYQADAKLVMLGVDYHSSTYVHLVEVMHWRRLRARDQAAAYPALKRPELGAYWDHVGEPQRGPVGDAACRLFSIRAYVDGLLAEVGRNGHLYLS